MQQEGQSLGHKSPDPGAVARRTFHLWRGQHPVAAAIILDPSICTLNTLHFLLFIFTSSPDNKVSRYISAPLITSLAHCSSRASGSGKADLTSQTFAQRLLQAPTLCPTFRPLPTDIMSENEQSPNGGQDAPPPATEHLNIKVTDNNNEVFFKIKRSTKLEKLMNAFCDRQGKQLSTVRFLFDGQRVRPEDSPDTVRSFRCLTPMSPVSARQLGGRCLTSG